MVKTKNSKSILRKSYKIAGFTLIELMVVISLMGVVLGLVLLDFSRHRYEQGLKIAQNEMVTNSRKVQSYSLFSRNVGNVKPAQYYFLKFSLSTPDRYYIQAITDLSIAPKLHNVETLRFPQNTFLQSIKIKRPVPPYATSDENVSCSLLGFKAPFGRIYVNNDCLVTNPAFEPTDSYEQVITFVNNQDGGDVSVDTDLVITIGSRSGSLTKQVLLKGVTGLICPTTDEMTCSF